jgi:hypothetical protein
VLHAAIRLLARHKLSQGLKLQRIAAKRFSGFVNTREPIVRIQLTAEEGRELRRYQSLLKYIYLIAHVDMHNYLEIIGAIPSGDGWEDNLLRHIEKAEAKK